MSSCSKESGSRDLRKAQNKMTAILMDLEAMQVTIGKVEVSWRNIESLKTAVQYLNYAQTCIRGAHRCIGRINGIKGSTLLAGVTLNDFKKRNSI